MSNSMPTTIDELSDDSPMKGFYREKVIFVTGATGVLGELFIEKLLRCGVKRLYILMRSKKQKTLQDRLNDTISTTVFERLGKLDPNFANRISIIEGDVGNLNLGISADDQELLNGEIEITLHVAANVRFDSPLEEIILSNVRGTREMIRMAKGFRKLVSFSYISTAYCHSHALNASTEERFYRPPIDPDQMIALAEHYASLGDRDMLVTLTEKFIYPWPNTYSFSKAITEELVRRSGLDVPVSVVRPSIVIATHEDPIPGYCTNYFGLNGVLCAAAGGVSRVIMGNLRYKANIICADFAVNSTLAIVWDSVQNKIASKSNPSKEPVIYTINSGSPQLTWGRIDITMNAAYRRLPWEKSIWLASPNYTVCPFTEFWLLIIYHLVPGLLIDWFFKVVGAKTRILPVYRRIVMFLLVIKFFMNNQWHFVAENIKDVHSRMTPTDREFFPMDVGRLDWDSYSYKYALGLRMYIAKEPIDNLEQARRKHTKLLVAHYAVLSVYYVLQAGIYYLILRKLGIVGFCRSLFE